MTNEGKLDAMRQAVQWLHEADALLISAGAGMGVDSGLPDFRGDQGLWAAYPALGRVRMSFESIANVQAFVANPKLAWGFYGHRLALYRDIEPHAGFGILKRWADKVQHGAFVYTSNVDGQFQKAGFPSGRIVECHGSIHYLQCSEPCSEAVWSADGFVPLVDADSCLLNGPVPRCRNCGGLARPHILMFDDTAWLFEPAERQRARLDGWLGLAKRLVVVELGAGTALPTVRRFSERHGPRVIRINARESSINPKYGVGLEGSALQVLQQLDERLGDQGVD